MKRVKRDLIEYHGISGCYYKNLSNLKQLTQDHIFHLPLGSPTIDQLIKVWVEPDITESQLIKTSKGYSLEGQIVTGYSLLVSGDIDIKFQYLACEPFLGVHTANKKIPFCDYVVLHEKINIHSAIKPSILIEDIFCEKIDSKCIYTNLTITLIADVY